ncbi:MAG: glycine cleavage system aminomethyltransferase GcvT [Bacteroidaceae bacterium]
MKETPFHAVHVALGAKMAPFAGYDMPVEYSGIINEHMTVINDCGVFDVSHMGEFWVKGPHALALLQKISSNNVAALTLGKIQYTTLLHENGGIVDDFLIYYYGIEKYLCVVNAANIDKDWAYFNKQNTMGAELENASDNMAQLAIQGPKAIALLQKLTAEDLSSIPYYTFKEGTFADVEQVILSHTGYTGCDGFEIYFYPKEATKIWNALFEVGADFGLKPIGLGARDTLRLEAGFCLYGHELNDETTPIEAGLGWITKFVDGKEMLAKDLLAKQKMEGVSKKLVGIELTDRGIPREGYLILDKEGHEIGHVTSGTMSPIRRVGIAMGYVDVPFNKLGTEVGVAIRQRVIPAVVVKPPFRK